MKATKKKKTIEAGLLRGMEEALAHSKGQLKLKETDKELPGPAPEWSADEIRHIRKDIYFLSQEEFAVLLNVKTPTIRSWEQGQKLPSGSAARLLEVLSKDRTVIKKLSRAG